MNVNRLISAGRTTSARFIFIATCGLTLAFATCASATFGGETLPGWGQAIDPDGDCSFDLDEDSLSIVAPGPTHGLSAELNRMNAPRVLRPVEGDFIVELQVNTDFTPGEKTIAQRTAYQGSGLLLMKDDQTYIRLEAAALVRQGRPRFYANFELRVDGRLQRFGTPGDFALDGQTPVWLRLERRGDQILGAVSQESGEWNYLPTKSATLPAELQLGVAAINASSKPLVAKFADMQVFVPQAMASETTATVPQPAAQATEPPAPAVPITPLAPTHPATPSTEQWVGSTTCTPCCRQSRPTRRSPCRFFRRR